MRREVWEPFLRLGFPRHPAEMPECVYSSQHQELAQYSLSRKTRMGAHSSLTQLPWMEFRWVEENRKLYMLLVKMTPLTLWH